MQYFEWYLPEDCKHWQRCRDAAKELAEDGITFVWLPPAYKGQAGIHDVGYGVYDTYDLGEFNQKGTIPTKYGTKEEYIEAIHALQAQGVKVLADIVLNHRMGADEQETVLATKENWGNRFQDISGEEEVRVWTKFTFPGRAGKYSDFQWNWTHFDGTDWDEERKEKALFRFKGKAWETGVDNENGNYDYLMGDDLDMGNPEVMAELERWGTWYLDTTGIDGMRLDAVKHINYDFFHQWLNKMREYKGTDFLAVGEYWSPDNSKLINYLNETEKCMQLFDVPLHFKFCDISHGNGNFDMRSLLQNTLTEADSWHAVTFVDNHDTQPGQALQSFVMEWFKPLAYGIILLQEAGIPCVFYGDYYGIPHDNIKPMENLKTLMLLRKEKSYGIQHDYFDNNHYIGWTQEGDEEHIKSGIAVVISNAGDGFKRMYVGTQNEGETYIDALNNCEEEVTIDSDGCGNFGVKSRSVSVWIKK